MGSEWSNTSLGNVVELKRGYDLPKRQRESGSVPLVSSSGISDFHAEAKVKGPGVVTGRYGTIGQVFYVEEDFWPLNTTLYVKDFKGNDPRFISYFLQTINYEAYSDKAAVPGVNRNHLHLAEVNVPPLPEQRAIAHVLGTLDDKIELNRRMNETLEGMARALFKSWFVDFDPVRAKMEGRPTGLPPELDALFPDALVESALGEIPVGWEVGTIGDLCEKIYSGGTPSTKRQEYWGGDIPWLSSGETRQKFIIDTERTITLKGVEESSTKLVRSGATVIASAGQGFTRGQTSLLLVESYINQSVVALLADLEHVTDQYLFFDLERRYEEFRRISDAHSSRGSLTTKLLAAIKAVHPNPVVIEVFSSIIEPLVQRIEANLKESHTLEGMRDSLLPKLVAGDVQILSIIET